EQILTAIANAVSTGSVGDVDSGFITKVKEQNTGAAVTFWVGTTAQYNALAEIDPHCIYVKTDDTSAQDMSNTIATILDTLANVVTKDERGKIPAECVPSESSVLVVHYSKYEADKTYAEVVEAINAGKVCILEDLDDGRYAVLSSRDTTANQIYFFNCGDSTKWTYYRLTNQSNRRCYKTDCLRSEQFRVTMTQGTDGNFSVDSTATAVLTAHENGRQCVLIHGSDVYHLVTATANTCLFEKMRFVDGENGATVTQRVDQVLISQSGSVYRRLYSFDCTLAKYDYPAT
ncbi:MAG: hypothetical protein J6R46_06145, partial [Clostridia bacterium]|nr:hypothetical protein [Clostridia bacterium]